MPDYRLTLVFVDELNGETSKTYSATFADYATAAAAAAAMKTDAQALSDAAIIEMQLSEVTTYGTSPVAGSRVFERISATMDLGSGKKANHQFPAPKAGAFSGNALNPAASIWTAYTENLESGAWAISDGEHIVDTISGKRIFVRSGNTNLPV